MAYSDFTLEQAVENFALGVSTARLFPNLAPVAVTPELARQLEGGRPFAFRSEKARSEFIVAPILLEVCRRYDYRVSVYSGQRFDVEPADGLAGECDFILSATEPIPLVRAPVLSVIEAKKADLESGYGQCAAQMVAALRFNRQHDITAPAVYGCVTNGAEWQFLRLADARLTFDDALFYLNDLERLLGVFARVIGEVAPEVTGALGESRAGREE